MSKVLKSTYVERQHKVSVGKTRAAHPRKPEMPPTAPIKNASAPATLAESHSAASEMVHAEIQAMRDKAAAEADTLLKQAQTQATQMEIEARQKGWDAGFTEGRQTAQAELSETIATWKSLADSAIAAQTALLKEVEREIGKLALAIAKKLLGHALTISPQTVSEAVAQIIEAASIQGACRIRVNPQDYEVLRPHWDAVAILQQPDAKWELIPDKQLNRGGFLIDVGGGTIDARLETQIDQIELAFADVADTVS